MILPIVLCKTALLIGILNKSLCAVLPYCSGDTISADYKCKKVGLVWFLVFNSYIMAGSFLLVEEPRVPGENHRPVASN